MKRGEWQHPEKYKRVRYRIRETQKESGIVTEYEFQHAVRRFILFGNLEWYQSIIVENDQFERGLRMAVMQSKY